MKALDFKTRKRNTPSLILVQSKEEYNTAKKLIREYADSLDFSLDFQDIRGELNSLSNYYGPPKGLILLVKSGEEYVGVTCLRNLGNFIAEIKRMYLKPSSRGKSLGRRMLNRTIEEAKRLGYRHLRLDTVPEMESAIHLYSSTGFYRIEGYNNTPIPNALFMEYKL